MKKKRTKANKTPLLKKHRLAMLTGIHALSHSLWRTFLTLFILVAIFWLPLLLANVFVHFNDVFKHLNVNASIMVYVKPNTSQHDIDTLKHELTLREDVKVVKYISPKEGLEEFEAQSGIKQLNTVLDSNPLPGVFILQPTLASTRFVAELSKALSTLSHVDNVALNSDWLKHITQFMKSIQNLIAVITFVYLAMGIIITSMLFYFLIKHNHAFQYTPLRAFYLCMFLSLLVGVISDITMQASFNQAQTLIRNSQLFNSLQPSSPLLSSNASLNILIIFIIMFISCAIAFHYKKFSRKRL